MPQAAAAPPTATTIATAISTCCSSTTTAPRALLRNDGGNRNNWVSVRVAGTKANRSGIGAVVRVTSAQGTQWQMVRSGSSYCSQSDLAVTFGLGKDTAATSIEVEWPGGARDRIDNVRARQLVTIEEGRGLKQ